MRTRAWAYEFNPRGWRDLRDWYAALTEQNPKLRYLVDIVESVESSEHSGDLAGTTSMHDLVVTDTPVPGPPNDVIIVRAPGSLHRPTAGCARVEHHSHSGRNDEIERPDAEAVPLFWRFVLEKFGLVGESGRSDPRAP